MVARRQPATIEKGTVMAVKRITNRDIPEYVEALVPFRANSTRGEYATDTYLTGRLPRDWADRLHDDNRETSALNHPLFVVYSYGTPIAWWTPRQGWTVPDVRYSVTTSKAQGLVRRGLHGQAYCTGITVSAS